MLGGLDGAPALNFKRGRNGAVEKLPGFHQEICAPGEAVISVTGAGGGYGSPLDRPPEKVAATVNRGWLTVERAREIYAVALATARGRRPRGGRPAPRPSGCARR